MPKIRYIGNGNEAITVAVQGGTDLLTVCCRNPELALKFGCKQGECGICAIKIESGEQNLSQGSKKERETLKKKGLDNSYRLACQCAVNGDVTIV